MKPGMILWATALAVTGCSETEIPTREEIRFTEQEEMQEKNEREVIYDTIPVEEYYTVTSKLSSQEPNEPWSDTIFRRLQRPLSRWLEDGFIFVNSRRDTLIVYLNGEQGVWMSEGWKYWTLED